MDIRLWIGGLVLAGLAVSMADGAGSEKKLINFGWDMMSPEQLAEKVGELQHLPFDGLTVRATNFCYPFYNQDVDAAAVEANVEAMSRIQWGQFTDNFMYLVTGAAGRWFDDDAWSDDGFIIKNLRAIARMGQAGGCRGILFDPEFVYWGEEANAWKYDQQLLHEEKTLDEYRAKVRQRGVQFIDAIEAEMPQPVFLTLFWGSLETFRKLAGDTDPKIINEVIGGEYYGLLHDFMIGVLEGADKGTLIIDGNESSYYALEEVHYLRVNRIIRRGLLPLIPEELRYKYRAQVLVGHAVYADVHSNTRGQAMTSTFMTPEERALQMEQAVYWALNCADQYVWFYTEKPCYLKNLGVAPEMIPAIDRARRKVAANQPLDIDLGPIHERAGKKYNEARWGPIEPLTAEIAHAVSPPKMDGRVDDAVWENASQLGPFQNFRIASEALETATMAYLAYDDTHLYIAFHCQDPEMEHLAVAEKSFAHEALLFWQGDVVEVALAADDEASQYYHIKLSYNNLTWDALTPGSVWPDEIYGKNSSWEGQYETATHIAPTFWSAELAIPWATLNRPAPQAGDQIKGQLIRRTHRRRTHRCNELSSWSQMRMARCVETSTLGTWKFQ